MFFLYFEMEVRYETTVQIHAASSIKFRQEAAVYFEPINRNCQMVASPSTNWVGNDGLKVTFYNLFVEQPQHQASPHKVMWLLGLIDA